MVPRLDAICVTRALKPDDGNDSGLTGIDKAAVEHPVRLTALGVVGDKVMDAKFHGGRDKAAYAYAREDAAWWAAELGRDLPPGSFGENLATSGLDVTGAVVGERWRIGAVPDAVVVEVSEPRIPCETFQRHLARPQWVKRFTAAGAPGAYLRVVDEGEVRAGDEIAVLSRPAHGVTVGELLVLRDADPARLRLLMEEQDDLGAALGRAVERRLRAVR